MRKTTSVYVDGERQLTLTDKYSVVTYFESLEQAERVRESVEIDFPSARLVEYNLGWAVQYRKSGPYYPDTGTQPASQS